MSGWSKQTRAEFLLRVERGQSPRQAVRSIGLPVETLDSRLQDPEFATEVRSAQKHFEYKTVANEIEKLAVKSPALARHLRTFATRIRNRGALSPRREEEKILEILRYGPHTALNLSEYPELELFQASEIEEILDRLVLRGEILAKPQPRRGERGRLSSVLIYSLKESVL